jgi:multiple sugar transport system ATP-binding protein
MRAEIKRMHQRLGSTIVYVTHDQIEAMTLGDRIAVMKDGVVQQFGSPQEIYDQPSNLFVAGFIGSPSMNFLRGKLTTDGNAPAFELNHAGHKSLLSLPLNGNADAVGKWLGREVVLGIRPEHVTDALSAHNGNTHGAPAAYRPTEVDCTVELTEPTGPDTLVVARFNDAPVTCRTHPRAGATPNQPLKLAFDLTKALLFDPSSEQRIV